MPLLSRSTRRAPVSLTLAIVVALIGLLAMQVRLAAADTVITYLNFSDASAIDLNGNAATASEGGQQVLRLTPATTSQSGSAFLLAPVTLADQASFSTKFAFQITASGGISDGDGVGADGLVFAVQTNSSSAGGGGGGIGFQGIPNSVGIEFDTYNNGEVGAGNHIGVNLNGSVASVATQAVATRMNDGNVWFAWVDYSGVTDALEVRLAQADLRPDVATLSYTVDLTTVLGQTDAFIGFTSGTGSAYGNHDIRQWTFVNAFNPVGVNAPPDANAGADQTVTATGAATSVALNGSASTDPDGDTLSYSWGGPFTGGTATGRHSDRHLYHHRVAHRHADRGRRQRRDRHGHCRHQRRRGADGEPSANDGPDRRRCGPWRHAHCRSDDTRGGPGGHSGHGG